MTGNNMTKGDYLRTLYWRQRGLKFRTANCLVNNNVMNMGQLSQLTDAELLKFHNFGRVSLRDVRKLVPKSPEW